MIKLFIFLGYFNFILDNIQSVQFAGIKFNIIENGQSERRYIWLHGDEQTARMALERHMKKNQGKAFLVNGVLRETEFFGGLIDPNRIFSVQGTKNNIQKYNHKWSPEKKKNILELINKDREVFLEKLLPKNGELLVAVHNNYKGYNVKRELDKSDAVSIKQNQNPRDFFICTNRADFEILAKSPYNVVLQESLSQKDDGSLSWAAIRHNVRYVNIETRLGWLSQQTKMLNYIETNLP